MYLGFFMIPRVLRVFYDSYWFLGFLKVLKVSIGFLRKALLFSGILGFLRVSCVP